MRAWNNDERNFNPRSPHGERPVFPDARTLGRRISIHAPRTGSDGGGGKQNEKDYDFNPRSPHGERRRCRACAAEIMDDFNPRSPHGERRNNVKKQIAEPENFNPRSPHGERRLSALPYRSGLRISIHAPRTGSDEIFVENQAGIKRFQSTLPARGATACGRCRNARMDYFNPRSPHGERPAACFSQPVAR